MSSSAITVSVPRTATADARSAGSPTQVSEAQPPPRCRACRRSLGRRRRPVHTRRRRPGLGVERRGIVRDSAAVARAATESRRRTGASLRGECPNSTTQRCSAEQEIHEFPSGPSEGGGHVHGVGPVPDALSGTRPELSPRDRPPSRWPRRPPPTRCRPRSASRGARRGWSCRRGRSRCGGRPHARCRRARPRRPRRRPIAACRPSRARPPRLRSRAPRAPPPAPSPAAPARPEHRHHAVAVELDDDAAVAQHHVRRRFRRSVDAGEDLGGGAPLGELCSRARRRTAPTPRARPPPASRRSPAPPDRAGHVAAQLVHHLALLAAALGVAEAAQLRAGEVRQALEQHAIRLGVDVARFLLAQAHEGDQLVRRQQRHQQLRAHGVEPRALGARCGRARTPAPARQVDGLAGLPEQRHDRSARSDVGRDRGAAGVDRRVGVPGAAVDRDAVGAQQLRRDERRAAPARRPASRSASARRAAGRSPARGRAARGTQPFQARPHDALGAGDERRDRDGEQDLAGLADRGTRPAPGAADAGGAAARRAASATPISRL